MDESVFTKAGNSLSIGIIDVPDLGCKIGMTICYDVRFPEVYSKLAKAGCNIILVPSAFMKKTGSLGHWEILLKARAIENQCYIVAAAQVGIHNNGKRESYGRSMIIGPLGEIIAEAGTDPFLEM